MIADLLELKRLVINAKLSFERLEKGRGEANLHSAIRLLNEMLYKNTQEPLNARSATTISE